MLCCGVLFSYSCNAQNKLAFNSTNFDFGTVNETDSLLECQFEFYNRSSKILIINKILSSCDCVQVDYKGRPLRMGESGIIRVKFNPKNQNGRFYKPIYLYHNFSKQPIELIIRGVVKSKISPHYIYPYELSRNILSDVESLNLGFAVYGRFVVGRFKLYNSGNKSVSVEGGSASDKNIRVAIEKNILDSGEQLGVAVIYDAADTSVWGTVNHTVSLKIDDSEILLPVGVVVIEDFSLMSENQVGDLPQLDIDRELIHLGEVESGSVHNLAVIVKNIGSNSLRISKINVSSNLILANISGESIAAKKYAKLKVQLKTSEIGRVNEYIELITNDVHRPMCRVRLVANVVKCKN